jgi:DNA invertase Pin-like site-specific DNA recombinase
VSHLLRTLKTFKAQGIEFVSFSEQMDTSTPGSIVTAASRGFAASQKFLAA